MKLHFNFQPISWSATKNFFWLLSRDGWRCEASKGLQPWFGLQAIEQDLRSLKQMLVHAEYRMVSSLILPPHLLVDEGGWSVCDSLISLQTLICHFPKHKPPLRYTSPQPIRPQMTLINGISPPLSFPLVSPKPLDFSYDHKH